MGRVLATTATRSNMDLEEGDEPPITLKDPAKRGYVTFQRHYNSFLLGRVSKEMASGSLYCGVSIAMVLVNKAALSSFEFHSPNSLLFFQCGLSLVLICGLRWLNVVTKDPLDWRVVKLWWPANMFFIAMVWSSFYSLKYISVPMITILKNSTNFLVILGDWVLFGRRYGVKVWAAVWLIILSSIMGGVSDLTFSWTGYTWQVANCVFTAAYSLYLKKVMEKIKDVTGKPNGLEESTMVLYNNGLALPWVLVVMYVFRETTGVWSEPALQNPRFLVAAFWSGLLAFSISFASLFFLSNTTVTTYSLTGSLNKVPLALLGMVFFDAPITGPTILSLCIGLAAGILFVIAKSRNSA